jgi:hypothetical protein
MKKEKKMLRLRVLAVIAGIFLASIFSSAAFADAVLSVVPTSSTVSQGDTFAVDVNIAQVTDLYDFEFDLTFDPAVLQATTVLEGTFLSSGGSTFFIPGTIDNTDGTITFNTNTLLTAISGVTGNGVLVEFDFIALANGASSLDVSNVIMQNATGELLDDATTGGSVKVQGATAVPEPSILMLLTGGLLALSGLALKRIIH